MVTEVDFWTIHLDSCVDVLCADVCLFGLLIQQIQQLIKTLKSTKIKNLVSLVKTIHNKINAFSLPGWAQPALSSYWLLKTYWWSRSRVKITEVTGSQRYQVKGKVINMKNGNLTISGKIKDKSNSDFKMHLTSNVSNADFQLGYCVTGTLERGNKKTEKGMTLTHYAMIKRRGYWHSHCPFEISVYVVFTV